MVVSMWRMEGMPTIAFRAIACLPVTGTETGVFVCVYTSCVLVTLKHLHVTKPRRRNTNMLQFILLLPVKNSIVCSLFIMMRDRLHDYIYYVLKYICYYIWHIYIHTYIYIHTRSANWRGCHIEINRTLWWLGEVAHSIRSYDASRPESR